MYDTYNDEQLKAGDPRYCHFRVGDKVDLPDGLYVGCHSVVVILQGKFAAQVLLKHVYVEQSVTFSEDEVSDPSDYEPSDDGR